MFESDPPIATYANRSPDIEDVPDDIARRAVRLGAVEVECVCGATWYDISVPERNRTTECPNCGDEYKIVG